MATKHWIYLLLHFALVLVGVIFSQNASPISAGIGSSLIATGISGWVIFLYVFVSARLAERMAIVESSGIRGVFTFRSVRMREEYDKRLIKAKEGIDLIGFGLRALREDYANEFAKWGSQAHVRILILDPEFPSPQVCLATLRDREEGNREGSISDDVLAFIRACAPLIKREDHRFQVRLYKAMPNINYFRIDNEAFWGPYFVGVQSRNTPTFLISRGGNLFPLFAEHFDRLWSGDFSREIPQDWLN